jgi:PAS domain S-box-containing protein
MKEQPEVGPANILLVDDTEENLVALEAILEPLGQNLIKARSGEDALRMLLHEDVAVILLDVRMPELDGFETAALIKQRGKTRSIPIIFLTAISKDEAQIFRGYSTGAVDYLFKPFNPDVLRSKVGVFIDLYRKTEQLRAQSELLRRQELTEARRESEVRYRALADAVPQIVWTADRAGKATYYNRRFFEYTGLEPAAIDGDEWIQILHPDDLERTLTLRKQTLATGDVFETEYRFRDADGVYRWHLGRAVPVRTPARGIDFWVGTATDIDGQKRTQQAQDFLLRAGAELSESLDFERTLRSVAQSAVPEVADWCRVDLVEPDGSIRSIAIAHADPAKVTFARELDRRYPTDPEAEIGSSWVIRNRRSTLVPELTDEMLAQTAVDDLQLGLLRELGLQSYMCVPLVVRDHVAGAVTFVAAESGRRFDEQDLRVAEELARRAAIAVENAQLYREVEERAQAARVLAAVGDGVMLLGTNGVIRLWNTAAEAITGLRRQDVIGRTAHEVFGDVTDRAPVAESGNPASAETLPVELGERELWLSISGVDFEDGIVYAFRDLTEERALEEMRQDLVATVSHELRTPLAAIYGSAMTLRRGDVDLEATIQDQLLGVIAEESSRLADIVNDLLLASQLDSGKLAARIERCDPRELVDSVVAAARTHIPERITLEVAEPDDEVPPVAADETQLRQVLTNVIDNAVKYSPDGGAIRVTLEAAERHLRFAVADRGLGIPAGERDRIFEKFYRLDPDMTRGIGGTGLGLYICRELVRRVHGRIWVEPNRGRGSIFVVEIPVAGAAHERESRTPAATAPA